MGRYPFFSLWYLSLIKLFLESLESHEFFEVLEENSRKQGKINLFKNEKSTVILDNIDITGENSILKKLSPTSVSSTLKHTASSSMEKYDVHKPPQKLYAISVDRCKGPMKASPHRNPPPMSELNFFPINSLKPFQTKWIEKEDDSKICDQESSKCDSIHSLPAKLKSKDPARVLVSNTLESHGFFNVLDEEGKGKNLQYLTQISEENFEKKIV